MNTDDWHGFSREISAFYRLYYKYLEKANWAKQLNQYNDKRRTSSSMEVNSNIKSMLIKRLQIYFGTPK